MPPNSMRSNRLQRYFVLVLRGEQSVQSDRDFKRFLGAILDQNDASTCIERIIASPSAQSSLRGGLRMNMTPEFINKHTMPFIRYLLTPTVKQLCDGQFLQQLLTIVMEPPTLWNSLLDAFRSQKLHDDSIHVLAGMVIELLSLPASNQIDVAVDAQSIIDSGCLFNAPSLEIRALGQKIKHILLIKKSSTSLSDISGESAGGRHDNDFADFRQIAILPTSDEFVSTKKPFYRQAAEIASIATEKRIAAHLDNQFRLLREDMLSELREDFHIALGQKKRRSSVFSLRNLSVANISFGDRKRFKPFTVGISSQSGLEILNNLPFNKRKKFLRDNRSYLKHKGFGCLTRQGEVVAFANVDRDIYALCLDTPVVMLQILGYNALGRALLHLKQYKDIEFVSVDASIFAYEPILKCLQDITDISLAEELILYKHGDPVIESNVVPTSMVQRLRDKGNENIQHILQTNKAIKLDESQLESLLCGLTQSLSLIQGPPGMIKNTCIFLQKYIHTNIVSQGTGKSFIGALLAKLLRDQTQETVLVMCYTNHALDQFLEDLLDIGIPQTDMVRLGSKSTTRTAPLTLWEQKTSYKRARASWDVINRLQEEVSELKDAIGTAFGEYKSFTTNGMSMMDFLEFECPTFYEALSVPEQNDGMEMAGKNGNKVKADYLFDRWIQGQDACPFVSMMSEESLIVWEMDKQTRQDHLHQWTKTMLDEQVGNIQRHVQHFNRSQDQLDKVCNESTYQIIKDKRIIGCTTTAAAMHAVDLRRVSPGIILLEEAGEILESHVLTALSPQTKKIILIGDHQQLRPKINNYSLTVEKGDGYDLNQSLFERLVLTGYPHTTLTKQHRMCPQISTFVRQLSYPKLEDDAKTLNRSPPRGLQDRVIFFNHEHPELAFNQASDKRDQGAKVSKRNEFEVELVWKIVKYLGQQGYGTDSLVILTPYLGQLYLLRDRLKKENDPVLNDLDSYDLRKAGLISQVSAKHTKRPIRISTIDNYQGEESDIVIASLTRSNKAGEIGFMSAPQRLNVLLSRARDILIMVGNANTFTASRKGGKTWTPFINQLNAAGHLYDGLPVKCEQHPHKRTILKTKTDFDNECPDGGCPAPCGVKLGCGLHECPSKCHQISDHSKMPCLKIVDWTCPRNHQSSQPCFQVKAACRICNVEDRAKEKNRLRDLELDTERERKRKEYALQLTEFKDEIAHLKRLQKDKVEQEERSRVLRQHQEEKAQLQDGKNKGPGLKPSIKKDKIESRPEPMDANCNQEKYTPDNECGEQDGVSPNKNANPLEASLTANDEREWQKKYIGAHSNEIDALMGMVGLDDIKNKFLAIKSQVDTAVRQNVDIKNERFGAVLLGNPGTGKTTVARLYAKFLASAGILPGSCFVETTGSRLANDGVSGCQKTVDKILNNGGGALFIDEVYQLVQSKRHGGTEALNFLLAEVENLKGRVVVILAGYQRQMEKFFAHNPALLSQFPHEFVFRDYEDDELLKILGIGINRKYQGRMKIEDGIGGLYCRIVSRRIGRGRVREGFSNARAVENTRARISGRQSERLACEQRIKGTSVDDLLITKEDLIGPEPVKALENCASWWKLQEIIGLETVKKTVGALVDTIQYNYKRELEEKPIVDLMLNKIFLGPPGTGKMTVAKLYGQILVDIGMLSNGEVVVKNPADFIGSWIGESEKNTKGILASTVGKVLVIDEAYALYGGSSNRGADYFKLPVINTIVAEAQSTPGDDRCVILLGYNDEMQEMLQNVNPGLSRQFPLDSAFVFEDFTDEELGQILDLKLKQQGFEATKQGRKVALNILGQARNRSHFGNAGEIDIMLNGAKLRYQKRLFSKKGSIQSSTSILEPQDFDEDFDRGQRTETDIPKLFEGVVGCEEVITKIEGYARVVKNMRELDMDPREQVPFNFLFRGPPGSGKTSTARKMGKVYYDMGLLSSAEVLEQSATDLIGECVDHTGPKTQRLLEKGLGRVLFIDEAYRLAEGHFAKQAMDEIVDLIAKPKFAQRLIIILAGYDKDINHLMSTNPVLTSRFPESIEFNAFSPDECIALLTQLLQGQQSKLKKGAVFNLYVLECPEHGFWKGLRQSFLTLSASPNWANGRDVQTLAKDIFGKAIQTAINGKLEINESDILAAAYRLITERNHRGKASKHASHSAHNYSV